jgi:hypothetical protein
MPQWLSPLEKPVNQEHVDSMQAFMGSGPRPFDLSLKAQTNASTCRLSWSISEQSANLLGCVHLDRTGAGFSFPFPLGDD